MRVLARILRQADAVGRPLLHALEDEVDAIGVASRHPMEPRQDVVLLAHPLLGPLDRDRMIARIGFHPALVIVRPLAQHLLADLGDTDDVAEEVHDQLRRSHCHSRYLTALSRPELVVHFFRDVVGVAEVSEAVIDEDQELAEQLGEDVPSPRPRNGRSTDRAKLCATAVGFDSPTRFTTSSDGQPLATDATSLSSSRPKQAMLGSSTPPTTSPHASPATAIRNPSPLRKPTPASKSLGPATIASTGRQSRRVSTIVGYPTQLLAAAERR